MEINREGSIHVHGPRIILHERCDPTENRVGKVQKHLKVNIIKNVTGAVVATSHLDWLISLLCAPLSLSLCCLWLISSFGQVVSYVTIQWREGTVTQRTNVACTLSSSFSPLAPQLNFSPCCYRITQKCMCDNTLRRLYDVLAWLLVKGGSPEPKGGHEESSCCLCSCCGFKTPVT